MNIDRHKPIYTISVAAEILGVHPRTLRIYEDEGLVKPQRTLGNTRMYSQSDLDLIAHIRELTQDRGVNLAGVKIILEHEGMLEMQDRQARDTIIGALSYDRYLEDARLKVEVASGVVTLTGTIFDRKQKEVAEMLARTTDGVVGVKNELTVVEPTYDTLKEIGVINSRNIQLIADIRSALDYHHSLNASAIKVKSARRVGVFYLRGYVNTTEDRKIAEELSEKVSGVRYVVNDLIVDEDFVEAAESRIQDEPKEPVRTLTDKYFVDSANMAILVEIKDALARDRRLDASRIAIAAEGFEIGIFHLTGAVPSEEHRRLAGEIASRVRGVRYIDNDLEVKPL